MRTSRILVTSAALVFLLGWSAARAEMRPHAGRPPEAGPARDGADDRDDRDDAPGDVPPGLKALMSPRAGIPPRLAERLGIPDDKLKQIRDAAFNANDVLITLRANVKRARLNLDRLLSEATPDEKKILAQVDALGTAQIAVRKNRVRLLLKVRSILGPELWQKLQAAAPPFETDGAGRRLALDVGSTLKLNVPHIARIAIGDPEVADFRVQGEVVEIVGRKEGRTTLLVWTKDDARTAHFIDVRGPGLKAQPAAP